MLKKITFTIFTLLLVSCSSPKYRVDSSKYKAVSYNDRARFVVLHYTALNDERSITALTKNNVSAHYLVTQKEKDPVYSLVPNTHRAWHAGQSSFDGYKNLNDNSIGIEIANLGYPERNNPKVADMKKGIIDRGMFYDFNEAQIYKIGMLLRELTVKYKINPKYIVGHSDIAPLRKHDPGPKFPWKHLYDKYKVGAWYNQEDYNRFYDQNLYESYSIPQLKKELKIYGYEISLTDDWDLESAKVISVFQMHFRPQKITGTFDLETFAIIKALNKKYR